MNICLFVIYVWHPRFPLSGIKNYVTCRNVFVSEVIDFCYLFMHMGKGEVGGGGVTNYYIHTVIPVTEKSPHRLLK